MVVADLRCHGAKRVGAPESSDGENEQSTATKSASYARCRGAAAKSCPTKALMKRSPELREGLLARAGQLLDQPLDFVPHPSFAEEEAEQTILGHEVPTTSGGGRTKVPRGATGYLASLYETELLSAEQEADLFRRMNYLKHQAELLRRQIDPQNPCSALLDDIDRLVAGAKHIRNQIVRANLRLVVSIAKQYLEADLSIDDLISDGNIALMRAVEKFDFSRGFRFSTYATWAIRRLYYRSLGTRRQRSGRFLNGQTEVLSLTSDERLPEHGQQECADRVTNSLQQMIDRLSERERLIILNRFGLNENEKPRTLQELGQELGISKERVRQIEGRALEKLRDFAQDENLTPPEA